MLSDAIRQWCDKISAFQWLSNNVCYLRGYLEQEERYFPRLKREAP